MKLNYIKHFGKFAFAAVLALGVVSCEDDEAVSAGEGDPLTKNIVSVDAMVTALQPNVGEGNLTPFAVTIGNSFSSDATVTVKVTFDNGDVSTGTALVSAGTTTGTGSLTMPSDDGFIPEGLVAENAGTLSATAILLDELVEGTTYVVSPNSTDIGIFSDTLGIAGGLNSILDFSNPQVNDLDFYVLDENFQTFESSTSFDRFERDLFETVGRPDGVYTFYVVSFGASEAIDYQVLSTLPDGSLNVFTGTLPVDTPQATFIPVGSFEKITDEVSGTISYTNFTAL
ncbi:hypothetical protein JM84_2940 [Dokdonia sp. Hel_I_63]|uniref:hypothetical protein n=1 Tax=Dokdonia sp. Hel_I_63 TaxID=1249996 RepID=UPI00119AA030|nr:hypothetical protein [Dokdonia sp. Hel_I_63]TVZ23982.1 hypothetical protein JM84_2940 [Dokdonia sp. Hel_I_63]